MTLTRRLTRALERIKALEAENASLKEKLESYQSTFRQINWTPVAAPGTTIAYVTCPKCHWLYPFGTEHTCPNFSLFSTTSTTNSYPLLGDSMTMQKQSFEADWWQQSWPSR